MRSGRERGALLVILLLSLGLRVVLVLSGGQNYWPDESRYERSQLAAKALWARDAAGCLRALNKAEHFLFRVIGVIPASLELAVGANPKIPALFFSLFSVASLLLMWGIVRRLGEIERVALSAVGLLALCSSFLYYSRHLLPYDAATAFGLLALFAGLRTPLRAVDSLACGFLAACAFLTYNGYWTLAVRDSGAGVSLAARSPSRRRSDASRRRRFRRPLRGADRRERAFGRQHAAGAHRLLWRREAGQLRGRLESAGCVLVARGASLRLSLGAGTRLRRAGDRPGEP